jgi:integrase/recombinase XerD
MELERVFSSPVTLQKLRSAPLGMYLNDFCAWLLRQGFSRHTIRLHLVNVSHFNKHLIREEVATDRHLRATDVDGFFASYPSWCQCRGSLKAHLFRVRKSLNRFVEFLCEMGLFDTSLQPPVYHGVLDAYLAWMAHYQHAASGTLQLRAQYLRIFLTSLGPKVTTQGIATLTAEDVEAFFLAYSQKVGRAARRSMQAALRTFFRFCLHEGYLHIPLDLAVPTLRTYKLATVPRGLTENQAHKVLQNIKRDTPVGRRDYAILQMLFTYGVRGGQLRALRMEQIYWDRNLILFEPLKHGKSSLLPLTREVGESILDYLQNSRADSPYPQVFLTARAPYRPLPTSSSLAEIVARHIRAAGIDTHHRGAHVFRHAFATRMLQQGHPLKAVADILGHRHLGTTFLYTKVDFDALRQVALDWPEEAQR